MSEFQLGALSFGGYNSRDLFHFFINHDQHYDKLHLAKEFSEFGFKMAEEYMKQDQPDADFPSHFTFVPYSPEAVTKKVISNYNTLWNKKYAEWMKRGMPTTFEEGVIGNGMWWAGNFERLRLWLLQRAPFNLTDGSWLRQAVPTGPINEVEAKLFSVFIDEIGNGDVQQNHCNCFSDVLKSVGYIIPDVRSREFVDMKEILESAFTKPTFVMAASLFSSTYFPEILGFTLWLEVESPPEHAPCAKLLEKYNLNPTFSLLHTAIDNMENGHARYALDACIMYVEDIKKKKGEQAAQEAWRRIWRGYTSYGIVGDFYPDLFKEMQEFDKQCPRQKFIELIRSKSQFGNAQHGVIRLDGQLLDKMFGDPVAFEASLATSKYVEPGDPWNSLFLTRLIQFDGPMYQVFTTDELNIITAWIISLKPKIEIQMYELISRKGFVGNRKHGSMTLPVGGGEGKRKIDELFNDPIKFMEGLKTAGYCDFDRKKGSVDDARLIRMVTGGNKQMTLSFTTSDLNVMREWILAGSPVPSQPPKRYEVKSNAQFVHKL